MLKENNFSPVQARPPTSSYVSVRLEKISDGKRVVQFSKDETVFSQGDHADAIYFIDSGRVKVSVVSPSGKEGVLALLGPHSFFGESSLVGQALRPSSATVVEAVTLFQVEKRTMLRALRDQPELSEKFTAALLSRNMDLEEDVCDQLFNDSEKRLARVLIKISNMDESSLPSDVRMSTLSHETLSEMVGTTRSRVTHFMNKFRKLGLIEYKGHLTVKAEKLTKVVLQDDAGSRDSSSSREH
jgi:CRP-like cAMP-binding protein